MFNWFRSKYHISQQEQTALKQKLAAFEPKIAIEPKQAHVDLDKVYDLFVVGIEACLATATTLTDTDGIISQQIVLPEAIVLYKFLESKQYSKVCKLFRKLNIGYIEPRLSLFRLLENKNTYTIEIRLADRFINII